MPVIRNPITRSGDTNPDDIRQIKNILNRLGYYEPDPKIGMNDWPDDRLFDAVTHFQKDHNLTETGTLKPDDATLEYMDQAIEDNTHIFYIWHSVADDLVRPEHLLRDGKVFAWDNPPAGGNPGEDHNCRCWAEPVADSKIEKEQLAPRNYERQKIPGTNIPDFGIPEQGWPGFHKYSPYLFDPDPILDIQIEFIPPKTIDPRMPVYEEIPWPHHETDS